MRQGDFFFYKIDNKGNIETKRYEIAFFQYKRVVIKESQNTRTEENCTHWKWSSLYPKYPIKIQLLKDNIIIYFYSFSTSKDTNNYNFLKASIILPFDDIFAFSSQIKMMQSKELIFNDKYKIDKPLFFSKYFEKKKEKGKSIYLFEIFLDFLYDFYHNDVFKYSEYYNNVKSRLNKIPIVQYILAKAQFLYYKQKLNNTDLFYEVLNRWLFLLEKDDAENIMFFGDNWFKSVNKEIDIVSEEIFIQKSENTYIEKLKERVFLWQLKNFQITELLGKGVKYNLLLLLILSNFLLVLFLLLFPSGIFLISSLVISLIFLILLLINFGFKKTFNLISFEIFLVSIAIWESLSLYNNHIIIPYEFTNGELYIFVFIPVVLLFFMLKKLLRYSTFLNIILIFIINFIISSYSGILFFNLNQKDLLTSDIQKQILQEKGIFIQNPQKIIKDKFYIFSEDNIKNLGRYLKENSIIPNQIYFNLQKVSQDSLLYLYSRYKPNNQVFEEIKLLNINIILLPRYIYFWSIISSIIGIFVFLWVNSKIKGKF